MNTLSKFDGKAVALNTVITMTAIVPKVGTAKQGEKFKRIEVLIFQTWKTPKGDDKSNAYPVAVDIPESANFAQSMGAVFFRVRQLVDRLPGFSRNKPVNIAMSIDGQAVSTTQVQYGGVRGTEFLPGVRKGEAYVDYQVRRNEAFRNAATKLTKQIVEVFNPNVDKADDELIKRLGSLASAE